MTVQLFGHRNVSRPDGSTPESWYPFTCGHCGHKGSAAVIGHLPTDKSQQFVRWLQCTTCHDASVQTDSQAIYPGIPFGPTLEGLPAEVEAAYREARNCMAVAAYTAADLLCRKILMHVAVDKKAKESETFASYIDYLAAQGYVTPPMKEWVTLIKQHGNAATHKLEASSQERAEGTVYFTAQLLRNVYEMEHLAKKFTTPPKPATKP